MMNILHLNDKIEISGGVEVSINNIIYYLKGEGIGGIWMGIYKNKSGYTYKIKDGSSHDSAMAFNALIDAVKKVISSNKIDVIHVHSISNPQLLKACFELAPVVRSMHEPRMFCPGQGKFWRKSEKPCEIDFGLHCLVHAYSQACMNRHPKRVIKAMQNTSSEIKFSQEDYKAIFVMSQYMLDESVKVGIPRKKLHLNPYLTKVIESKDLCCPDTNGLKRILFVGRLSRTKGVHYFIKTGIEILKQRNDVIFDIVGDGHDKKMFQELIPNHLIEKFQFHGWKTSQEIEKILAKSYLMIFPSIYPEAFGISGIEAMMQGKPVVGFDVGGVSTWLKDNQTGFLVPLKDVDAMVKKVNLLLQDNALYLKMSKQSRDTALQEFSPRRHTAQLIKIYEGAMGTTSNTDVYST